MFPENQTGDQSRGWIEVICGSMFSGKTEELIRRLRRAEFARMRIIIFKPLIDNRYDQVKIVTHRGDTITSVPVSASSDIIEQSREADVIGIDEAQFFDMQLPEVCCSLADRGKRVIVCGLDLDYLGKPFGSLPHLMAVAEYVTKIHAICLRCGHLAYVSNRKSKAEGLVVLGETDVYEPLCRHCYNQIQAKDVQTG
jgi:thymidine kinase